jgi:hypothetical protein
MPCSPYGIEESLSWLRAKGEAITRLLVATVPESNYGIMFVTESAQKYGRIQNHKGKGVFQCYC